MAVNIVTSEMQFMELHQMIGDLIDSIQSLESELALSQAEINLKQGAIEELRRLINCYQSETGISPVEVDPYHKKGGKQ